MKTGEYRMNNSAKGDIEGKTAVNENQYTEANRQLN